MMIDSRFSSLTPVRPLPLPDEDRELKLEVMRLRDEIVGLRVVIAEAEVREKARAERDALSAFIDPSAHVDYLQGVVADLEFQLREVRASSTWKVGRVLLSPVWAIRSLFRPRGLRAGDQG